MMSKREVFDKVKDHLLKQGAPARNGIGLCRYRTEDGLKCAVGCLISDAVYDPRMEGSSTRALHVAEALALSGVRTDKETLDMLLDLQGMHDTFPPEDWLTGLEEIERRHFA